MKNTQKISFKGTFFEQEKDVLLAVPKNVSSQLPSRGMTSVEGTINKYDFLTTLEPDGKGSHLLRLNPKMLKDVKIKVGDTVTVELAPVKEEPEPEVPAGLQKALEANPKAHKVWADLTSKAHRDWIHWISTAKQADTRNHRIEVACSKLSSGMRRPCCFNNQCAVVSYDW